MNTTSPVSPGFPCALRVSGDRKTFSQLRPLAIAVMALAAFALRAHASGLALQPTPTNGFFGFQWQGDSNAIYTVQSTTNINDPASWIVEEPVKSGSSVGPVRWMAPEAINSRKFYRLALPQPSLFSLEPAAVVTGGLQTLYLTGELFTSNDVITIGGVVQTNVQFISSSLISVIVDTSTFVPDKPGDYAVQFTSASDNKTRPLSYAWSLVSSPASSTLLFEPPQSPPISQGEAAAARPICDFFGQTGGDGDGTHNLRTEFAILRGHDRSRSADSMIERPYPDPIRVSRLSDCDDNDPAVFPCSGEVQLSVVDMAIPGRGMDFVFSRTYRSRTSAYATRWGFCSSIAASQTSSGGIAVTDDTGRTDVYAAGTNGLYYRDQFFNTGSMSNGAFVLTFPDTSQWLFNPFDGTATAGRISSSVDRNGNRFLYVYDGTGQLSVIVDDLNRTNVLTYDSSGQLASLTDFTGRSVTYTYYSGEAGGSPGDLKSVTSPPVTGTPNGNDFPLGKTTTYTYSTGFKNPLENHLLLSVTDAKGQVAHQYVYQHNQTDLQFLRCISAQCGYSNEVLTFSYLPQTASPTNGFAVMRCIVNDAVGNVVEYFFDSRNRLVQRDDYTGRATPGVAVTAQSNRPTGKLRASDPDYYCSQWTWNNDSLCTQQIDPLGITTQMLYERDFNPNATAQKKGDLRILREIPCCGGVDTDGDGVADLTARAWHMTYDPRFGSGPSAARVRRVKFDMYVEQLSPRNAQSARKVTVKGWDPEKKEAIYVNPRSIARQNFKLDTCAPSSCRSVISTQTCEPSPCSILSTQTCEPSPCDSILSPQTCEPSPCLSRLHTQSCGSSPCSIALTSQTCEPSPCSSVLRPQDCGSLPCSFVTSILDPRGTVVLSTFDNHGNLRETHVPMPVITIEPHVELGYNIFGQVTAITNAADGNGYRRVDTLDYFTTGSSNGYLRTWTVDATGPDVQIVAYVVDSLGATMRCIDPRGNDTLYTYNSLEQCVRIQAPVANAGADTRYTSYLYYDANNNLVQTSWENRDQNGVLGSPAFFSTSVSLDVLDCVTQRVQTVDNNHSVTTQYGYDANRNLTLIRSPEAVNGHDVNNITTCLYDERDLLFNRTVAPSLTNGMMTTYSYDAGGACARVFATDPAGNAGPPAITTCAYDGLHRAVSVTDAMHNVSVCAYDACDNLTVSRRFDSNAVLQAESACAYDQLDRRTVTKATQVSIGLGINPSKRYSSTTFTYAPNGECLSVTDDNGHATRYTYDTACRLASVIDAKENTVACTYDANNNLLTVTQTDNSDLGGSQVFVTTRAYDNLNRCSSISDNTGNTIQYAYDSRDNLVQQTDANGHVRGCVYDGLSRCTQMVADLDGDGLLNFGPDAGLRQTWDDDSRLTVVTDANTNLTSYVYDAAGRCILKAFPNGSQSSCTYDARGNVLVDTDANGSTSTNIYDLCDHVIHRDLAARNLVATTTTFETFTYDGSYRLTLASNDVSRLEFSYDTLGNCLTNKQDGLVTTCTYDGVGNCLSATYPAGRIMQYTYDAIDEVSSVSTSAQFGLPPATLATYAYEGPDRLGSIVRPNGVGTRIKWNGFQNSQGGTGDYGWQQVASVTHAFPRQGATQILDKRAYTYDHNQNRTSRAQAAAFNVTQPPLTNTWTYDALNRIGLSVSSTGSWSHSHGYQLDTQGNRITVTNDSTVDTYTRSTVKPPGNFQMDEYTTTPFGTEQYDGNGNLVQDGNTGYVYDCNNHLVTVNDLSGGLAAPVATFSYDALGNRLSQTVYPSAPQSPVTTYYVRANHSKMNSSKGNRRQATASDPYPDPPNCCAYSEDLEFHRPHSRASIADDGEVHRPYIEARSGGPNGAVSRAYGWSGDCIGNAAAFDSGGNPQYYHTDDLGNVLALTDAAGNTLERYEYSDYGTPTFLNADGSTNAVVSSPAGNPFLFHGMEWDGVTQLYHRSGSPAPYQFQDGRYGRCLGRSGTPQVGGNGYTFDNDNPWSAADCKSDETCGNGIDDFADDILGGRSAVGNGSAGIFLSQDTRGMMHLHAEGIVHRDIAARNFLIRRGYICIIDN